jgi:hypothetical protein
VDRYEYLPIPPLRLLPLSLFAGALPCHQKTLTEKQGQHGREMFPRPSCPVSWVKRGGSVFFYLKKKNVPLRTTSPIALFVRGRDGPRPHEQALRISKRAQVFPTWPRVLLPPGGDKLHGGPIYGFLGLRTRPFLPLVVYVRGPYEPATHGVKGCADHGQRGHTPL